MRRAPTLILLLVVGTSLMSSCSEGGSAAEAESQLPPEAAAAVDEYFRAINEQDAEGFLAIVNEAVYEYVFSQTTSSPAGQVAVGVAEGDFVVERYEEIGVELDQTVSPVAYVAISAVRPNTEPTPVNGIMVLELQEYPDKGWLITLDHRFGL